MRLEQRVVVGREPDAAADVRQFRTIAQVQSRRRQIQRRIAQSVLDGVRIERSQGDALGHGGEHIRFRMVRQQQQHPQKLLRTVGRVAILQLASQQREVGTEWLSLKRATVVQQPRLACQQRQIVTRLQHVLIGYCLRSRSLRSRSAAPVSRHAFVFAKDLDAIQIAPHHARLMRMLHRDRVRTIRKPRRRELVDPRRLFVARRVRLSRQWPELSLLFREQLP